MSQKNFFDRVAPSYEQWMRNLGFIFTRELFDHIEFAQGMRVLDLGGGPGIYSEAVSRTGAEVALLDSSTEMLEMASRKNPRVSLIQAQAHQIPFDDGYFDVVLCMDALHHFQYRERVLREMARVLKKGGRVYIQEFDGERITTRLLWILESLMGEKSHFYSPVDLTEKMRSLGIPGQWEPLKYGQFIYLGTKE